MQKLHLYEVQTFRQEPDCYDGKSCDLHRPRWMTSYPKEGDQEEGDVLKLEMPANKYPPGTRVTIELPSCPNCGDGADTWTEIGMKEYREWPNCKCGFSWKKWVEANFA